VVHEFSCSLVRQFLLFWHSSSVDFEQLVESNRSASLTFRRKPSMNISLLQLVATAALAVTFFAQSPPAYAATSHATCKDGTQASAATGKYACSGHGGVAKKSSAKDKGTTTKNTKAKSTKAKAAPAKAQAPGAGPDKVWANTNSKNYHCPGGKYYGKTRTGVYMKEADAKAQGFKGKVACTK
jgi:hypothetical protein